MQLGVFNKFLVLVFLIKNRKNHDRHGCVEYVIQLIDNIVINPLAAEVVVN